ncbi:MAG: hypothetical protein PHH09_13345 [Methanoregulaceae archaeon]|nr:hypothetical protein [Methanoregulaceae archaeon]
MNLSDFGVCGTSREPVEPVSAIEIDEVQRGWSLRGRGLDMALGDASYVRARVEPLAARLGVEPGLLLISPALARWP